MNIEKLKQGEFIWFPRIETGYYEVEPGHVYDKAYFDIYAGYENNEVCGNLNQNRVDFVRKHWQGEVLDIGIGSGTFINAHGDAKGYDINPAGVEWLESRGLYMEPYSSPLAMTFWDSLEHIRDPEEVIKFAQKWVFVSLPIFKSPEHAMKSKHFRPYEHYWYFTIYGFMKYMERLGFRFVEFSDFEIKAGREDIGTFAFKRIENGYSA